MARLKDLYTKEIAPAMLAKYNYKSVMQIPKLDKIVVNVGVGDAKDNTFTVARYGEVHREHMRTYHVFFDLVQPEIALCVFCGARGVDKAVKAVTAVVLVPVVEKIIMQKRPAHE